MGYYVRGNSLLGAEAQPFIGRYAEGMDLSLTLGRERHVRQFLGDFLTRFQVDHVAKSLREHGAGNITDSDNPFCADAYTTMKGKFRVCVRVNTPDALRKLEEVASAKYGINMQNPVIVSPEEIDVTILKRQLQGE